MEGNRPAKICMPGFSAGVVAAGRWVSSSAEPPNNLDNGRQRV